VPKLESIYCCWRSRGIAITNAGQLEISLRGGSLVALRDGEEQRVGRKSALERMLRGMVMQRKWNGDWLTATRGGGESPNEG